MLHAAKLERSSREAFAQLVNGWAALVLAPIAISYDSALAAFLATFAVYAVLGFSGACLGLCYCVGFRSERAIERCAATSALLLAARRRARARPALIAAAARRLASALRRVSRAAVFASPVAVVGALTLYLALLITSSLYYRPERRSARDRAIASEYAAGNRSCSSACCSAGAGALIGAPGWRTRRSPSCACSASRSTPSSPEAEERVCSCSSRRCSRLRARCGLLVGVCRVPDGGDE